MNDYERIGSMLNEMQTQFDMLQTYLTRLRGFVYGKQDFYAYNRDQIKVIPFNTGRIDSKPAHQESQPKGLIGNIEIGNVFSEKELKTMPFLKEGKPRKREDGVWEIRYRRNGYNKSFSSRDLNIAKEKFKEFILEIKKQPRQGSKKNFAEVAEIYLYQVKKPLISAAGFKNYETIYRNHIKNRFGSKLIDKITPLEIQSLINDLYRQGKTRTIEDVNIILRGIFGFAVANKYLKESPLASILIPKHQRQTGCALTLEEERELLEKMRGHSFEQVYLFMLYSGVRRTEVLRLKWKDVDFEKNSITCYCAKVKNLKKGQIVTRKFPIFPKLKALLLTMRRGAPDDLIFDFAESSVTNTIKKYLPNHKAHDLRHTFVTRARECGIERDLVSLWVGHSLGNNVTSSVYTHFSDKYQQAEALKLNY